MAEAALPARHTSSEELANSVTHGFGLLLSIAGLIVLMAAASALGGGMRELASCGIYGASLILVYTTSTLYHSATGSESKRLLRTLDHVAIFLLIAGTYTPFVLIALRGIWGWSLFAIVWALAVMGVVLELTSLRRFRGAMVVLYIAMGWVGLIALEPLVAALPSAGLWLLFGGGVSYTFGVLFYVWHLFVLAGSVLQYFAVLCYVLPGRA
jgi:hemolysin III